MGIELFFISGINFVREKLLNLGVEGFRIKNKGVCSLVEFFWISFYLVIEERREFKYIIFKLLCRK